MLLWRARAIIVAFAIGACSVVANDSATDPSTALDEAVFKCKVEPILARQCSYNACHGNAGSALRVYTPGKLRVTMPMTIDDAIAPLTDIEQHANFLSAAGFAFNTAVDDNFLLRKPLPAARGGFEHVGGAIYADTSDAQYTTIRTWLSHQGTCN
jgi:hypothetical protein